jgi:hypothetical protein
MLIRDLFRHDINRHIEEVVKVDLGDEAVVVEELDEYVVTHHILGEFEKVCDAYQEAILVPNQSTNVWVSGFFGSGKSAWAKTLGYLLENPTVVGRAAAERFFERANAPALMALCNTIHSRAPTLSVFLNLATGSDVVAREGESVVLPVYRALLKRLGYSANVLLAELEWDLEGDRRLGQFEECFAEVVGRPWSQRRYNTLARSEASRTLHVLNPATFPQADSWTLSATEPIVDATFVATRATQLLARRGDGAKRIVFVVDEAGQYVARSVERMLALQGLAEACQVHNGQVWLVITSQESLQDVFDSLESSRIELARVRTASRSRSTCCPRISRRLRAGGCSTRPARESGSHGRSSGRIATSSRRTPS